MDMVVIQTERLTKIFHDREALADCSLCVTRGSIYGLLGRNGAGKTTLMKLLLGYLRPTAGSAAILGFDSVQARSKILQHTGHLIETPVFVEHLSAEENLRLHLAYLGCEGTDVRAVLAEVGLPLLGNQPVSSLSLGMRQRLAIARALVHGPEVLILDEPTNGLDPAGMHAMRGLFRRLADERGVTILLSTHLLGEIAPIADRIGILSEGRLVQEVDAGDVTAAELERLFLNHTKGGRAGV